MSATNADIAAVFDEIADLLEVKGGNVYRVRAYRSAARTVASLGRNVADMLAHVSKETRFSLVEAQGQAAGLFEFLQSIPAVETAVVAGSVRRQRDTVGDSTRAVARTTEASIYAALGLAFIEPELREARGEIEAAGAGILPQLVMRSDLRGDLRTQGEDGGGRDPLRRMAEAARASGLEYLAITAPLAATGGPSGIESRFMRQAGRIDALNEELAGITLLKGVEAAIGDDGRLQVPRGVLARADLVVGPVHGGFDLPRAKQTDRLRRAMDHRAFAILAHPTSRVLGSRPACDIDMEAIVRHAAARGCFLELDADPLHLDLDDIGCRMAKDAGVLVSIASGARSAQALGNLDRGIGQARRGWLEPADVLNARPLHELRRLLAGAMGRPLREAALA